MTDYVAGLMFSPSLDAVVLISKLRPEHMKGKLNAVGGKIEKGEGVTDAMIREFAEETGVTTTSSQWRYFCKYRNSNETIVHFFCSQSYQYGAVKSMEDEGVGIYKLYELKDYNRMHNLDWLIALALDGRVRLSLVEE